MSRLPTDNKSILHRFANQDSRNSRASAFDKLNVELDIKDIKYDHKMREQFDLKLNQMDSKSAKTLLLIKDYLVDGNWLIRKYDDDDCVEYIQYYFRGFEFPIDEYDRLIHFKSRHLLPEVYINWLRNNLRRSLFLASLIEKKFEQESYQGQLELLEAIYNCLRYEPRKFNILYNLPEYQWTADEDRDKKFNNRHIELVELIYFNNCVSDKDIKWIVPSDAEQIEWAYDYLEKEKRREKEKQNKKDGCIAEDEERDEENNTDEGGNEESYIPLKRVFFPQNTQEKYELILATIDRISNVENPPFLTNASGSYSERAYVLHKMQNAWNSRKGPSDKVISSNEVTVKLSKKSRDTLNKLPGNSKAEIDKFINKCIEEYVKKTS